MIEAKVAKQSKTHEKKKNQIHTDLPQKCLRKRTKCTEIKSQWGKGNIVLEKQNSKSKLAQKAASRFKWTKEEDELLVFLVSAHGKDWARIAQILKNRTGKQVRERYINVKNPKINHSPWSPEEDQLILKLMKEYGTSWSEIGKHLNHRPENKIKNRYYSFLKKQSIELKIEKEDLAKNTIISNNSEYQAKFNLENQIILPCLSRQDTTDVRVNKDDKATDQSINCSYDLEDDTTNFGNFNVDPRIDDTSDFLLFDNSAQFCYYEYYQEFGALRGVI